MSCDFSFDHYQKILQTALASGYSFCRYDQIKSSNKACVLRHDIDYCPERVLELATREQQLGISAYYFFLINTEVYNLREAKNYKLLSDLLKMGHQVGLHYDLTWDASLQWEAVAQQCKNEKIVFKQITNIDPCEIISFHNPHKFQDLILNKAINGMQHTYEQPFFSEIKYLSDSQGWYEGCPCKIFENCTYPKIQLLTHPYIWSNSPQPTFIEDMAVMIREKSQLLCDMLVKYHPQCEKQQETLRKLLNN